MDVMAELMRIGAQYSAGDFRGGLRELSALWARVTDQKPETSNAYLIVEYGVALSLKEGDFDLASEWAERVPMFAAKRHDLGEVEFLVGKVAFARGEMDKAKELFRIANTKSEGRIFEAKDAEYRRLLD